MRHGGGMHGGGSLIWGLMGFVGTLVVLALLALLVVYLIKRAKGGQFRPFQPGGPRPAVPMSALQVLDDRLAKGEVDVEDYLTRRAALMGETGFKNEWTPQAAAPAPAAEQPVAETAVQPENENESAG